MASKTLTCPQCASDQMVPIVYGLPDVHLLRRAEHEEVILGGCTVTVGESPDWACKGCGHQYADEEVEDV